MSDYDIIELFAGPGGMSEGMRLAGIDTERVLGIEWDESACETARAAGHHRLQGDVSAIDPRDFGTVTGFHASPPCQGFSMAGLGKGRGDAGLLMKAIEAMGNGRDADFVTAKMRELANDERSALTLEPMRWIADLEPEWVTLEQVPAVLPLWEKMAEAMRKKGYSVVTANLQAEQYGVPQTRKRAVLIASRVREVSLPTPLHSRYYPRNPEKLDEGLPRWVSMAEALGWGMHADDVAMRSNYGTGGDPANRGERRADQPAATVTSKAGRNKWVGETDLVFCATNPRPNVAMRSPEQPAPTLAFGHELPKWWEREDAEAYQRGIREVDREELIHEVEPRVNNQSGTEFDLGWPADRPAPVIAGRGMVTMPGANANRFNGATKSRNDGIRVTVQEAGILQSFSHDYPWQGTKTAQFRQCGDAVPVLLAAAMVKSAIGVQPERGRNEESTEAQDQR